MKSMNILPDLLLKDCHGTSHCRTAWMQTWSWVKR